MKKTLRHINNYTNTHYLIKGLVIYCLVFFITTKPLFKIVVDWAEGNFEICEHFEKSDSHHKEKIEKTNKETSEEKPEEKTEEKPEEKTEENTEDKTEDKKEKEHEYYAHELLGTYSYWEIRISNNPARKYFETHQVPSESYLGIFLPPPEIC